MPDDLTDKAREVADVSWRLSKMALELAQESREAVRSTVKKIERSRQILDDEKPEHQSTPEE